MADLSKLSDEQLAVYRDLIAKRAPQPATNTEKAISNIPSDLMRTVARPYGEGAPGNAQENYQRGEYPKQFSDYIPEIKKFAQHPIDYTVNAAKENLINRPIQSTMGVLALLRGAAPEAGANVDRALTGVGKGIVNNTRPVLDKFSLWHPLRNIGTMYDAGKNVAQSARDEMNPPVTSPFDIRQVRSNPSSGGVAANPQPTNIEGTVTDARPSNIEDLPTPAKENQTKKTVNNLKNQLNKFTKDTRGSVNLGRFGGSGSGLETPVNAAETRAVQPVNAGRGQVPEVPTNVPSAFKRNVIFDEKSEPVAYDDPENPYQGPGTIRPVNSPMRRASDQLMRPGTEAPDVNMPAQEIRPVKSSSPIDKPYEQMQRRRESDQGANPDDVFTKLAQEGLEKRKADAKAKYDDVYNNVIKGQYTPEQIRTSATDPELKTQLDMKVKSLKHPEGHVKSGKAKYSSGLNPDVIEHLASRLEAENP